MTDKIFAVFADLHGGHTLGMMRPGTMVPRERIVIDPRTKETSIEPYEEELYPNAVQEFLHESLKEDLIWLHELAAGRPIVVKINGDVTQGQKYVREWVTTRISDQIHIAAHYLRMILALPTLQSFGFISGTGSHEFEEATSPILLRTILQPETKIRIGFSHHSLVSVNGVVFDIAHHGPGPGSRRWLEGNGLRWYMNDLQQRSLDLGKKPPDWVVRSHYHTANRATSDYRRGTTFYKTEGVLTPSYSGMDAYARQAVRSKFEVHVGMVAWEVPDNGGMAKCYVKFRIIDTRNKEVIE